MKSRQILALDFDGVIADSILECLVTAYNAFSAYQGLNDFRINVSQFSESEIIKFRESRIFIRRGEDYVFLLMAAYHGTAITSQLEFDAFLDKHDSVRDQFRELFYGMRVTLQTDHQTEWLALSPVYPEIEGLLKSVSHPELIYVVTTKDLASVQIILKSRAIFLNPEHMFQATKTLRKPEILKNILSDEALEPQQLIFIDDHPGTVLEVAEETELSAYCAAWGYNTPTQLALLEHPRVQVLALANFNKLVENICV